MADPKQKKPKIPNQIVVSVPLKQRIEDIATALSREEKKTVTQGEVVFRAVQALEGGKVTPESGKHQYQYRNPTEESTVYLQIAASVDSLFDRAQALAADLRNVAEGLRAGMERSTDGAESSDNISEIEQTRREIEGRVEKNAGTRKKNHKRAG